MPVTVAVLLMVVGALAAAAALAVAGWAWLDWSARVPARGGVVGREGRGSLFRSGRDALVFVRRARRYVLPLEPEPDQAVRRTASPWRGRQRELTAHVFRGSDHVIHTIAVDDDRGVARLVSRDLARARLTAKALVPRLAASLLAVGVIYTVPWLGVWVAGETVEATITNDFVSMGGWDCTVTWPAPDGAMRRQDVACADDATAGGSMAVRALAPPFDGAILAVDGRVVAMSVVGLGSVAGLAVLVGRAVLTMRRRPVTLSPMTASTPGFDGSMPNDERRRARSLALHDLAVAVQRSERHGDVEDNDLFRSRGRALWMMFRRSVLVGVAVLPVSALYLAAIAQSIALGVLGAAVVWGVFAVVVLVRRGRLGSRVTGPDGWGTRAEAAAWRRLDGRVFAILFDPAGGAVWSIPVDRVFAPDARVEIGGGLADGVVPAVRANGVDLFAMGPAERVSAATAMAMRQELVRTLTGRSAAARALVS